MKDKMTPDQSAMIIADWEHGELTSCEGYECDNCALNKRLPKSLVGSMVKLTMCNVLMSMCTMLSEVEHD